jgi:exopolyphosphatase / guanosine-5'-triphosphate,3'-diphosphate pyrophosphatase
VLEGSEEGRLTFLGATAGRTDVDHVAVVDIGGGSTEIIAGSRFSISLQMGVVRFTERHLHHDPPESAELQRLTAAVREVLDAVLPARLGVETLIAVAGTATSAAAIAHDVEPYDPDKIHGSRITAGDLEEILARLAILPNAERREVRGLHPDRAPTIVAGIVILLETVRAFGLDEIEISEHDLLVGAALDVGRGRAGTG